MLKSFVFLTLLIITDVVLGSPDYKFNKDVNGWLKLHKVPALWQDAFTACYAEGAVLASPLTTQLEVALRGIMLQSAVNRPIFLGANSFLSETDFMSIEGVPLDDMSLTWGSYGDDATKPEDCLTLSNDGKVYASSCKQYLPYICYKKKESALQLNECGTFDDDYHFNETTGSCYKVHAKKTTWNQAYKTCVAEGAHLIVINDEQEADLVKAFFLEAIPEDKTSNKTGEWKWVPLSHIGLRDWNKDFAWVTVTGDRVEDVYHKWASGQPDNKGANVCTCILEDGTLDDHWCGLELKFVCEKDPKPSRFERVANEEKYNRETIVSRQLMQEME